MNVNMDLNLLDTGILVIIGLLSLRGYFRGFGRELAGLAGMVLGVIAAAHSSMMVADRLSPWIANPAYAKGVAFALLFFSVNWITRLSLSSFQQVLYVLHLGAFDRLLGFGFSLLKGGLFLGLSLMLAQNVIFRDSQLLRESRLAPYMVDFSQQALALLPSDIKQRITRFL